jgi:hypothetical protein
MTEEQVRTWLKEYAWVGMVEEQAHTIDCIMAQDHWKYIDARADQYSGAQNEPGPEAFSEGVQYALSELYECHAEPHIETCPDYKED